MEDCDMVFYRAEVNLVRKNEEPKKNMHQEKRELKTELSEMSEHLYQRSSQQSMVIAVSLGEKTLATCVIAKDYENAKGQVEQYVEMLPLETSDYKMREITIAMFESMLRTASRNDYISDDDEIMSRFAIGALNGNYRSREFGEALIDNEVSYEDAKKIAKEMLFSETLGEEIERIYAVNKEVHCYGHPVHYLVQTDDSEIRKKVYKTLLSSLYRNGRVKNQRYAFVNYGDESHFPGPTFDALYRCSEGGAIVIRYDGNESQESGYANRGRDVISALCEIATKYKNKVLTIITIPNASYQIKEEFLMHWGSTAFIELHEEAVAGEQAQEYLKEKAKKEGIQKDKQLLDRVKEDKVYTAAELNFLFEEWYCKKLREKIYPQYKTAETVKAQIKTSKPCGSAYETLEGLIGLNEAKKVMNNALNYFKAQKIFADRGMPVERPSMHMVFTGNPGTAKTTVARLFAEIMKENGLLSTGTIYEVGRADIVGKYVGSTAPLVKTTFKRAKGGVLFIDEAYSLVDDRDGLYGDEAINTIVQEMENNREDTIVIFAGYPDKMEQFLEKNPGLRSRIAFHIPFEDYSTKELCAIGQKIAAEKNFIVSEAAMTKLEDTFEIARKRSDFGNGRYVRNVIEKAKMAQANRLMAMDLDDISDEDIRTICAEDIDVPTDTVQKSIKIGFCI